MKKYIVTGYSDTHIPIGSQAHRMLKLKRITHFVVTEDNGHKTIRRYF